MARVASPPTNLLDRMGKGTPLPGTDQKIRFMNEMTIGRGVAGGQAEAAGLGRSHAKWVLPALPIIRVGYGAEKK